MILKAVNFISEGYSVLVTLDYWMVADLPALDPCALSVSALLLRRVRDVHNTHLHPFRSLPKAPFKYWSSWDQAARQGVETLFEVTHASVTAWGVDGVKVRRCPRPRS